MNSFYFCKQLTGNYPVDAATLQLGTEVKPAETAWKEAQSVEKR
jgi:hypothetical protein